MLTYLLEMPPEEYDYADEPNEKKASYLQIMMSVPYNLNSYYAYLAVGIDNMYLNSTGIFDQLYYYTGPFERAQAGSLVEYTSEDGKGTMNKIADTGFSVHWDNNSIYTFSQNVDSTYNTY